MTGAIAAFWGIALGGVTDAAATGAAGTIGGGAPSGVEVWVEEALVRPDRRQPRTLASAAARQTAITVVKKLRFIGRLRS